MILHDFLAVTLTHLEMRQVSSNLLTTWPLHADFLCQRSSGTAEVSIAKNELIAVN